MSAKTNYANRTEEIKDKMSEELHKWLSLTGKYADAGHLTSCVANSAYDLTTRQWNGKAGSDAFASTLATLVMSGKIKIEFSDEIKSEYGLVS